MIPAGIATASDYEAPARDRMGENAWAYIAGGAGDERTLRRNAEAFDALPLINRALPAVADVDTRVTLFGRTLPHPILLAPAALHTLVHPDGEAATVLGAGALGAATVISTQAGRTLEDIAAHAAAPLWFQLYIHADRGFTARLVQRAEAAGYGALVVTVDAPVSLRPREQRAGFRPPPGVEAVNLRGEPPAPAFSDEREALRHLLSVAARWEDIAWLKSITRLPVLVKGVMHPDDAERAIAHGVDGIVVSNHGGRVLDGVPATIEVLPAVAARVAGRVPLLLDGGIRRGTDVLKALALGASAVMVGRPYLYALAVGGAVGVAHLLKILRTELDIAMVLTGCPAVKDVSADVIWR